ncbi:hypothetical protein GCM10007972_14290 [Iodidimonas muriae]|uniref:Uncharacterized protein n=1 Tax=Iodidimonas muriae TaxID=261467 RepID=A0ABQ2LCR6_9PROT|nr:hypothetical protein [Iodidimonas muriae]GER07329.1 hypothetical protein JCM17843_16390 [Kordiimonadales bacterium JCM 17843]GGO10958.1 hypothetical protein GCM10007972_14290 [Iodidimonas muriae]
MKTQPPFPLFRLVLIAGALALSFAAWRLYVRYGASDVTQAETIVYGMMLFIFGIALAAFFVVALAKLFMRFFKKRREPFDFDLK